MSNKRVLGRNMVWNTAGLAVATVSGFLLMPVLIHRMGDSAYGVWIVLGAVTSYFGLLDLGIRGSIGRHIALHHANSDHIALNQTLTSGLVLLTSVGVIATFVIILGESFFFHVFDVPTELHQDTVIALRVVAIQFALYLITTTFDVTLWGYQRFDLLNYVDIPTTLLRVALTITLIQSASDLVLLAIITLGTTVVAGFAKFLLCFWTDPSLRIGVRYLDRQSIRVLLGFGIWNLIRTVAFVTRRQLCPILIGSLIGLTFVAPYSITDRLIATVTAILWAATGVLTPFATTLHATEQIERQRQLFMTGTRYTAVFAIYMIAGLIVLGKPLIALWISPHFMNTSILLTILALGELLPLTQSITVGILQGCARHQSLAWFSIVETVLVCLLSAILIPEIGLIGAGLAIAIPAFFGRGVVPIVQGSRLLGVSIARYLISAILTPMLCGIPPILVLYIATSIHYPDTWFVFVAYSALYSLAFLLCYICIAGWTNVKSIWSYMTSVFFRRMESPARNGGIGTCASRD